jgi:fructoselysine-6-P-deglycase FrlB-like protein
MSTEVRVSDLALEIATQPESWSTAADLAATYATVLPKRGERVAVIGCGTSLNIANAYASMREASGHGETDAWPASEARLTRRYDRIVAISRSGTTTEVVEALAGYDRGAPVAVVTSSMGTPILELGEPILLSQFDERSVVSTRFATATLAILRAHLGEDLTDVIAAARDVLAEPDDAFAELRKAEQFTFVGMGLGAAIAAEAALKLREATQSWTESYAATEYRHGPISIAAPGRVVWALGPLIADFARDVATTGAHLEHREVDAMVDLLRVQRLCLLRAADRGIDPDRPRGLERSVILGR